jgi:LacI family transcriptional regulator
MSGRPTIALVYSFSLGYCRGTLRGITAFASGRPDWDLVPVAPERSGRDLRRLRPDGVIAHLFDRDLARGIVRLGVPALSTCGLLSTAGVPRVLADDAMVGRLAAGHLLERGLRSFAWIGHRAQEASSRRALGFRSALAEQGFDAVRWLAPASRAFDPHGIAPVVDAGTVTTLARLPRPLGVACANDIIARQLLELLRGAGIAVPEDMAVLGVDDDDLLCQLSRPPLSSVGLDAEGIGRTAAALLADWLDHGRCPPSETILVPRQVIARRSTDLHAGLDPALATALAAGPQHINRLAALAAVSRRTLERRARRHLGRGIAAELRRRRIVQAQTLLGDTALPVAEVARRTGFRDNAELTRVFRRELGTTPSRWRAG